MIVLCVTVYIMVMITGPFLSTTLPFVLNGVASTNISKPFSPPEKLSVVVAEMLDKLRSSEDESDMVDQQVLARPDNEETSPILIVDSSTGVRARLVRSGRSADKDTHSQKQSAVLMNREPVI